MARQRTFRHPPHGPSLHVVALAAVVGLTATGCPFGIRDVFLDDCCFADTFGRFDSGIGPDGEACESLIVSRTPGSGVALDAWQTVVLQTAASTTVRTEGPRASYVESQRAVPPGVVHLLTPTAPWKDGTSWTVETHAPDTADVPPDQFCAWQVGFSNPVVDAPLTGPVEDATWVLSAGAVAHPDAAWLARRIDAAADGGLALGVNLQDGAIVLTAHQRASGWPQVDTTTLASTPSGAGVTGTAAIVSLGDVVRPAPSATVAPYADGTARLDTFTARVDLRGLETDARTSACVTDPPLGLSCVPCDDDTDIDRPPACVSIDAHGVPLDIRR